MTAVEPEPVLEVEGLTKYFPLGGGWRTRRREVVRAVDGISFRLWPGETLGLVGESGSGKSTAARAAIRLIEPTAGRIRFLGRDLLGLSRRELRAARREMQVVFQDPYGSLNPRMTVGDIIAEPLVIHRVGTPAERRRTAEELLEVVGLSPAHASRYPHEFSGGQRQRIGIARALAIHPKLVVADEPVSALDVSVQAQILNLMADLQREFGLTYLFIAHGLHVVRHIADRVAVMYLGRLVELAPAEALYRRPLHPYTEALFSAIPVPDPEGRHDRVILPGEPPSPIHPPSGCAFHPRCPLAQEICRRERPELKASEPEHLVACHFR